MTQHPAEVTVRRSGAEASKRDGSTRLLEFALAFWLPLNGGMMVLPRLGVPVNEVAAAALVLVALNRRGSPGVRNIPLATPLLVGVLGFLGFSAMVNQQYDVLRLGHLALWGCLIIVLADGRLHAPSVARGLASGVVVGVAVSMLLIPRSNYPGRLTGVLGDPNTGGFFLVVCGLAACMWVGRRSRWLVVGVVVLGVYLASSRTTMAGLAVAVGWFILARGRGRAAQAAVAAALLFAVASLEVAISTWGPFEGRSGSDALRMRIDAASQLKASIRPMIGTGPGTANIQVEGQFFLFHSSPLAVRTEGGWLTLVAVLGLLAVVAWAAMATKDSPAAWGVAGLLAVVICSRSLGDVFLELPTAVVLGLMVRRILVGREAQEVQRDHEAESLHPTTPARE